jgi:biopolymer transport protein ExbD
VRRRLVRVGAEGNVLINGERVLVGTLGRRLERIFESRSDRLIFVWPEENTEFGRVAEVIDAAQSKTARFALVTGKVERDPGDCGPALMTPRRRVAPNPYVQPVGWW